MRAFFVLFRVNKNIYEIAGFLFIDRRPREMGPDSVRPYNSRNCVACGPFARGAARIKLGTIASNVPCRRALPHPIGGRCNWLRVRNACPLRLYNRNLGNCCFRFTADVPNRGPGTSVAVTFSSGRRLRRLPTFNPFFFNFTRVGAHLTVLLCVRCMCHVQGHVQTS